MSIFKRKPPKDDYTPDRLPTTRREIFRDVMRLHWGKFILFGLLTLAFALPLIATTLTEDIYYYNTIAKIMEDETRQAELFAAILSFKNMIAIIEIGGYVIFGIGLSGLLRVVRQYAWEENVYFRVDFTKGIKQNIKQTLLFSLLVGLLRFICIFTYNTAYTVTDGTRYLALIPTFIFAVALAPAFAYAYIASGVYSNPFSRNIRVGFHVYGKHMFTSLGVTLALLLPYVVQLINNFYCHIIGTIIGALIAPIILFVFMLFAFDMFDKTINKEHMPELIGRGTFRQ